MSETVSPEVQPSAKVQDLQIEILSWPLKDEPLRAAIILCGTALLASLVVLKSASFWIGLLAFIVLQIAFWRLWIPVSFRVGPAGIQWTILRRKRQIPWLSVGRYEMQKDGFFVLPTSQTTPILLLGGLFIPWCGRREELTAIVERHASQRTPSAKADSNIKQDSKT